MKKFMFILLTLILLASCSPKASSEDTAIAVKVVNEYYTALNNKDYLTMYSLISEGFKKIEPTANTYESFEAYIAKFFDAANGIRITSTKIVSATSTEVVVEYVALVELKNGATKELKSLFTVKKKPEGWKLVHPYGDKKDLS